MNELYVLWPRHSWQLPCLYFLFVNRRVPLLSLPFCNRFAMCHWLTSLWAQWLMCGESWENSVNTGADQWDTHIDYQSPESRVFFAYRTPSACVLWHLSVLLGLCTCIHGPSNGYVRHLEHILFSFLTLFLNLLNKHKRFHKYFLWHLKVFCVRYFAFASFYNICVSYLPCDFSGDQIGG